MQNRIQDIHTKFTPRYGGIFLIIPFIASILVWHIFFPDNRLLILSGFSIAILAFGLLDDYFDFNALIQLGFQILLAALFVLFGIKIDYITNPFGGLIFLGFFASAISALWIVSIINIVNWIDGIDGLSTSIGLFAALALAMLSFLPRVGQPFSGYLAIILAAILAVISIFTFPPAKFFIGTSGSVFLGFIIAAIAIISGGKIATAVLILGIPILDALWVIYNRVKTGKSIFKADKNHLHHKLLSCGLSQRKIVLLYSGISAIYGILAVILQSTGKFIAILLLPLTFFAILLYFS